MQITIDHRFTTLNEYILAERGNRFAAAKIKEQETEVARLAALGHIFTPVSYPVIVNCQWFRRDKRTDPDNIQFGIKFILDGFVKAGVLAGDNWKFIKEINNHFSESNFDFVIVNIEEVKDAIHRPRIHEPNPS